MDKDPSLHGFLPSSLSLSKPLLINPQRLGDGSERDGVVLAVSLSVTAWTIPVNGRKRERELSMV